MSHNGDMYPALLGQADSFWHASPWTFGATGRHFMFVLACSVRSCHVDINNTLQQISGT